MDSSSPRHDSSDSPTQNYSKWCDKHFTKMYSHDQFSPSRPRSSPQPQSSTNAIGHNRYSSSRPRSSPKPRSWLHKSLYASSRDRILSETERQVVSKAISSQRNSREVVMNDDDPYDGTSDDDSDDPFGSSPYQLQLKSVVAKVVRSDVDEKKDVTDKKACDQRNEKSSSEGSRPTTPDGGVTKRGLKEVAQESEIHEARVKKKKHKRHEMSSSSGTSVKMSSIVSSEKEVNNQESSRKKHGANSEYGRECGSKSEQIRHSRHAEARKVESEQASKDEKKDKEKHHHHRQRSKSPRKTGRNPYGEKELCTPTDHQVSEKREKKQASSGAISKSNTDEKDAEMPMLETEPKVPQPAASNASAFNPKPFKILLHPTRPQFSADDKDQNGNVAQLQKSTGSSDPSRRTESKSSTTMGKINTAYGYTGRSKYTSAVVKNDAVSTQAGRTGGIRQQDQSDSATESIWRGEHTSTKVKSSAVSTSPQIRISKKDIIDRNLSREKLNGHLSTKDTSVITQTFFKTEITKSMNDFCTTTARPQDLTEKEKSEKLHPRTSSTSSTSSTATTSSSMSGVSAGSAEDHGNCKVTRTSGVKMVSFKTAKHLHKKPKKGREGAGDNNKSLNKENSKKSETYADKAKDTRSKHASIVLAHIKKAFLNSGTDSESSDGSPMKKSSLEQHMKKSSIEQHVSLVQHVTKSLAASVSECAGSEQSASEKRRDGAEKKKPALTGKAILSHLPLTPFSIDALVQKSDGHTTSKEVTNKDATSVTVKSALKVQEPLCVASVAEKKQVNIHNTTYKLTDYKQLAPQSPPSQSTTYKLSEKNQHSAASIPGKFDSAMEIDDSKEMASPKYVPPKERLETARKEEHVKTSELDNESKDRTGSESNQAVDPPTTSSQPVNTNTAKPTPDDKMPELEDYSVEPGELSSDSEDDSSWSQMVQEVTKEKKEDQWDYVIDPQKRRLCLEGTTYAAPPIQWRTSWHFHGERTGPPPIPRYPPPNLPRPPPFMSQAPPQFPPPPRSLYQQASQRMYNPMHAWRNPYTTSWSTLKAGESAAENDRAWRNEEPEKGASQVYSPPTARHDPNPISTSWPMPKDSTADKDIPWRNKWPEKDSKQEDDLDGEIFYSSDEDNTTYDASRPYRIPEARSMSATYLGYKATPKSAPSPKSAYRPDLSRLPPRLQRQRQQQQYAPSTSFPSSPWSSSYNPFNEQKQGDSGDVVVQWDQYGNFTTPQSSQWGNRRNSFSPGTPFEYDTSGIVYPYSMRDYIDTHCHIDFLYQRLSYKGAFQKFATQYHFPPNYAGCVAIFCTPESVLPNGIWKDLLEENKVWGAFGIHPHHIKYYDGVIEENVLRCMKHPKAVAFGEIGLDYSSKNSSDWILQQEVFRRQLDLALKMDKPLVIHSRDAEDDTINIMASMVPRDYKIHRHCFTGTPEEARRWFSVFPKSFIGLTALVTFQSAFASHRTAQEIPLERLLLETDAPYFLPRQCPRNLKFANPSMAVFVAERIARLKGITTDEVLVAVRKNTKMMYGV